MDLNCKYSVVFLFSVCLALTSSLQAALITSTSSGGQWTNPNTWVGGSVPLTTDDVLINTSGMNSVTTNVDIVVNELTINANATLLQNSNITIDCSNYLLGPGGTHSITANGTAVTVSNNMTVNGEFNVTTGTTLTVGGDLTMNTGGQMINSSGSLLLSGDAAINGLPTDFSFGSITFEGTSGLQTVSGTIPSITVNSVTINNSDGVVLLNQDLDILNTLQFISGTITLGNNSRFVSMGNLNTGIRGQVTGASASNHVIGGRFTHTVIPSNTSAYLFPIGTNNNGLSNAGYSPFSIVFTTPPSTNSSTISIQVIQEQHPRVAGRPGAIARYWDILPLTAIDPFAATVQAQFLPEDLTEGAADITSTTNLRLGRWVGGRWATNPGSTNNFFTGLSGSTAGNTSFAQGATSFSDWTILDSPFLSVDLLDFTAEVSGPGEKPVLNWSTASETDNAGFHVYLGNPDTEESIRLTKSLIPAEGDLGGNYVFIDPMPINSNETRDYYLEDIEFDGDRTVHGPATASAGVVDLNLAAEELNLDQWVFLSAENLTAAQASSDGSSLTLSVPDQSSNVYGSWETKGALEALPAGTYLITVNVDYLGTTGSAKTLPDVRLRVFEENFEKTWMTQAVDRTKGNVIRETITTEWTTSGGTPWKIAIDLMAFQSDMAGGFRITGLNVQAK